jgi:hypothetical protein
MDWSKMIAEYTLTNKEKKYLQVFKRIKRFSNLDMEIDSIFMGGAEAHTSRGFLELFAETRNIKLPKFLDIRLATFGTVPMHMVCLSGNTYKTLLVVVKGKGLLSHYDSLADIKDLKTKEKRIHGGECFVFNDRLPHSYVNFNKRHKTVAIVADLPKKLLLKAQENEFQLGIIK